MFLNIPAILDKMSDDSSLSLKSLLAHQDYEFNAGELMVSLSVVDENNLVTKDISKIPNILIGVQQGAEKLPLYKLCFYR